MSKNQFRVVLVVCAIVCVMTTMLTATARFTYRHPFARDEAFAVTREGAVVHQATADGGPAPRAVALEVEHDFGTMNPLTLGTHTFLVSNQGNAPLRLQAGPTSCKCTLSEVPDDPIPPGGQGRVTLKWNTGRDRPYYAHEASVFTNDLRQKTLRFAVRGVVRMQLAVDPPEAIFAALEPDQGAVKRLLVYSQIWEDFEVEQVESSLPGLAWRCEPADEATREQACSGGALAARWLELTLPDNLPEGHFSHWLRFTARSSGAPAEPIVQEVPVKGNVHRRLAVYGPGIDFHGVVTLGSVSAGQGTRKRLLLKVRDPQRELAVKRIQARPDFLQVSVSPREGSHENGLFYLDVEIPPGAPRCDYLGLEAGAFRIEFEHPRISELELSARFAVVE